MTSTQLHSKSTSTGPERRQLSCHPEDADWSAIFTLVLWLFVSGVAGMGAWLSYPTPLPPAPPRAPVQAEFLSVELTTEPLPSPELPASPPPAAMPPTLPQKSMPVPAPAAIAVAEPSPAIAFPIPVEGPVRVVNAAQASLVRQAPVVTPTATPAVPVSVPAVQQLQYGQGEGRQPAPEYPMTARRQGQQGTVGVRFTVGPDGHVVAAEAIRPAPWPILTQAALRTVRDRWKFRPGPLRLYEVSIRFELAP
ncbi:MAG: TonB family protein [Verrucomicrobiales bacterium]|nr:TonB family protein [Verrucomicrobiales bacterium]